MKNKAFIVFAVMWNKEKVEKFNFAIEKLKENFGEVVFQTDEFILDYSHYYEKEMGQNLIKKFIAFDKIIDKEDSIKIKKFSENLEDSLKENNNRTVNIDPVFVDEYQVVALSRKDRGSRVYIGDGVYGELQLLYHHKTFQSLIWTYLDYKENANFFNQVRKYYLMKIND